VVIKDYYAELPIAVKVSGRYHDIGAFAADVSNLSRIVTLHNLIVVAPTGPATRTGPHHGGDGAHLPLPDPPRWPSSARRRPRRGGKK
jgi:hypothetical protein